MAGTIAYGGYKLAARYLSPRGDLTIGETAVANALPDDAFVVRGGLNRPQSLDAALLRGGISAKSAPGMTVEQLAEGLPHSNIESHDGRAHQDDRR